MGGKITKDVHVLYNSFLNSWNVFLGGKEITRNEVIYTKDRAVGFALGAADVYKVTDPDCYYRILVEEVY